MTDVTFRITAPHNTETDWHQWYFPGAYDSEDQVAEYRDKIGRRTRPGSGSQWLILHCNNTECHARAVVPVKFLTCHADASDPYTWDEITKENTNG